MRRPRDLPLLALLAAALAGCVDYAHVHMKNAPGVTDLSRPLERENGDPDRFEPAKDPGQETLTIIAMPSLMIGAGREPVPAEKAVYEPGLELRFEHHTDEGHEPFASRALAFTAGIGFAQLVDGRPAIAGPLFAELDFRFPTWNKMPTDIGLGPIAYPANFDAGGQLTVRVPFIAARARYLAHSGPELWIGFQIPIPFFFERSR